MSWEECGFRPGTVHGPATCRKCSDCDGEHHFYAETVDPAHIDEGEFGAVAREAVAAGHTEFFQCKHCDAWAEMVDDDDGGPFVCPGCHCMGADPHAADCIDEEIRRKREDEDECQLGLFEVDRGDGVGDNEADYD